MEDSTITAPKTKEEQATGRKRQATPPSPEKSALSPQAQAQQRRVLIGIVVAVVLVIALLATALVFLLSPRTDAEYVARIRDVFIIFMALESLLIGFVLILLIIQVARLTNLLQNEIKPILDSTNETVSTLRGTTAFLSDNLIEPVMKLNEYLAGLQQLLLVLGLARRKRKSNDKEGE